MKKYELPLNYHTAMCLKPWNATNNILVEEKKKKKQSTDAFVRI